MPTFQRKELFRYASNCLGIGLLFAGVATAVDSTQLSIAAIEGQGWSARQVQAGLQFRSDGTGATLQAETVVLPGSLGTLRDVHVECRQLQLSATQVHCAKASLNSTSSELGAQQLSGSLTYDRVTSGLQFALEGRGLTAQRLKVTANWSSRNWTLALQMQGADAKNLLAIANKLSPALATISAAGLVDVQLQLAGSAQVVKSIDGNVSFKELTTGNASGSVATDKLGLDIKGRAQRVANGWSFDIAPRSNAGQAYAEPVFLDLKAYPLQARLTGTWLDSAILQIDRFEVAHDASLRGSGQAQLSFNEPPLVRDLDLTIDMVQFPGAYTNYLQPFLLQTSFKAMQTSGQASGRVRIHAGEFDSVDLQLRAIDLDDGARLIALDKLAGAVHWRRSSGARTLDGAVPSSIAWQGGSLLGLKLGAAQLDFSTGGLSLRMNQPSRLPLLDGAIEIESLTAHDIGTQQLGFSLDANVQPISVEGICKAFDWPVFGGTLSGRISGLQLHAGVLTLGTTLAAQVFDGRIAIGGLRLEGLFARFPRLHSDIGIENVDLEQITTAFSFGRITGRLGGEIRNLTLFNWMPVAFDAVLATPAGDKSRHLISQRAVNNIGSLGGGGAGVTAALSSGFLKFFEDFHYDRLGFSCRLENEICYMNGVAPAPNGYYLVKGKGLPRIDVIGGAQRVDWPRMVAQLKAIANSQGPVIR